MKHTTLQKGLRGTDNCPTCGRAMRKGMLAVLDDDEDWIVLRCKAPDHEVWSMMSKALYERTDKA